MVLIDFIALLDFIMILIVVEREIQEQKHQFGVQLLLLYKFLMLFFIYFAYSRFTGYGYIRAFIDIVSLDQVYNKCREQKYQ